MTDAALVLFSGGQDSSVCLAWALERYARVETVPSLPEGLPAVADVEVLDSREKYQRCGRSWKRRPDVGTDAEFTDLSARDADAVRQIRSGK